MTIGDSSALHGHSRSNREGYTKLAIAPSVIGVPSHTERGHKIGENSGIRRRSQPYRAVTQSWRYVRPSSAFPIIPRGYTKLAIAPSFIGFPNHTVKGTHNGRQLRPPSAFPTIPREAHKSSDHSAIHRRSQSYRAAYTELAIAPPFATHTYIC